jgi:lipopolysaccharide transport system permease protein
VLSRVLIPLAAVLSCLVDLLLGPMVAPLMVFYDVAPGWHLLWLPAAIALHDRRGAGHRDLIAAVNVKYRDVRFALPFAIQLWLFAGLLFDRSLPPRWQWVAAVNSRSADRAFLRALLRPRSIPACC